MKIKKPVPEIDTQKNDQIKQRKKPQRPRREDINQESLSKGEKPRSALSIAHKEIGNHDCDEIRIKIIVHDLVHQTPFDEHKQEAQKPYQNI